jgi:DNA-binding MarR family transcriptional regulator
MSTKSHAAAILKLLVTNGGWMTRQEIGEAIGMHRYSVSYPIKRLEKEGLVESRSARHIGPGQASKIHRAICEDREAVNYIPLTKLDERLVEAMRDVGAWITQGQLAKVTGERQASVCRSMRRLICHGLVDRMEGEGPWRAPLFRLTREPTKDLDDPNSPWKGWALAKALGGLGYNTREVQQWHH